MTGEREQSTLARPAHVLHTLVDYYAICKTDWPLSDILLCAAVWYHIPSAEVVSGVAMSQSDGFGVPYCWIEIDGVDYDVLKMAQDRRFACHGGRLQTGFEDAVVFKEALRDIADYKLPTCPGCRGRHRAHTCDDTCHNPWKKVLQALREVTRP